MSDWRHILVWGLSIAIPGQSLQRFYDDYNNPVERDEEAQKAFDGTLPEVDAPFLVTLRGKMLECPIGRHKRRTSPGNSVNPQSS